MKIGNVNRPVILETATSCAQQVSIVTSIEEATGRASVYGIYDQMSAKQFAADSLELDFATGYFRNGFLKFSRLEGVPGMTFDRESPGTAFNADGSLVSFGANEPRITTAGLTVEPTRTNKLALRNANPAENVGATTVAGMTDAGFKTLSVVEDSAAIAAAGLSAVCVDGKAYRVNNSAGGSAEFIELSGTTGNTQPHALSCYMRADLAFTDVVMNVGTATDGVSVGVDYARVSVIAPPANASSKMLIRVPPGRIVTFILPQLEQGSYPTTPIVTTGTEATRFRDLPRIDGLTVGDGWTLNVEASLIGGGAADAGNRVIAALAGPTPNDRAVLATAANGSIEGSVEVTGETTAVVGSLGVSAANTTQSLALRISADNVRLARNGQLADADGSATVPALLTRLGIGIYPWSDFAGGVVIKRIAILPPAVTDSQLVTYVGGSHFLNRARWDRGANAAFPPRDSAKTFVMGGRRFIANGYQTGEVAVNDIWSSLDGADYSLVNGSPPYDDFSHVQPVGTTLYAWRESMWKSLDGGVTWSEIIADMPFDLVFDSPSWVHDGVLRCLAGDGTLADTSTGVWEFDETAVEWTKVATPAWGERMLSVVAEFDDTLYLLGGVRVDSNVPVEISYPTWTTLNDLWRSTDGGLTWSLAVSALPFQPRVWPAMTAYDGHLYILGGWSNLANPGRNLSDTYRSADGVNWTRVEVAREFLERHAAVAYVADGRLLQVSGNANDAGGTLNDIWRFYPADA